MGWARIGRVAAVVAIGTAVAVVGWGRPGGAGPAVASAALVDINGNEVGEALFTSHGDGTVRGRIDVHIDNAVAANTAEFHGFHVHANNANNDDDDGDGDTDDGCVTYGAGLEPAAGARFTQVDGHWDVGGHAHGSHTGDLPSLVRQSSGRATIEFAVDKLTADQLPGKALIVHFAADDFGKHPDIGTSASTGNAGPRYACGVIVASAKHG